MRAVLYQKGWSVATNTVLSLRASAVSPVTDRNTPTSMRLTNRMRQSANKTTNPMVILQQFGMTAKQEKREIG